MGFYNCDEDLNVRGDLQADTITLPSSCIYDGAVTSDAGIERHKLAQDALQPYTLKFTDFRLHDDQAVNLPNPAVSGDLGLYGNTAGTESIHLATYDVKAAGSVSLTGACLFSLPPEYEYGQTIRVVTHAGMITTVADAAATLSIWCYKLGDDGASTTTFINDSKDINSLTWGDDTFTTDDYADEAAKLEPGDRILLIARINVTDTATATVVRAGIGSIQIQMDVRG